MASPPVSYQGIPGSFSYLAAKQCFPEAREMISAKSFSELFRTVGNSTDGYGVVPIENSLAGSIHEVYDLLHSSDVTVCGEIYLRVAHCLLAIDNSAIEPEGRIGTLKKVYSHPKALEQCRRFFENNPGIEACIYSDTAGAAKFVKDSSTSELAAIAAEESAALYGLQILKKNLEDNPGNFTRFVIISKRPVNSDQADKGSLIFTLPHKPASLFKALEVFAERNLNVTKVESRPIHGSPFEYNFYIDFEFPRGDIQAADEAVTELRNRTRTIRVLGFYKSEQR
ncbi:MAG: prephenate dehydratase [Deltaproteobacteria bacterium]|nr:prephenate dehydratase [Deltaproteobacteria bacterium]